MNTHARTRFFPSLFAALTMWTASAAMAGPERVLIIGDSMMQIPAHAIKLALKKQGGVEAKAHTSIGSGLARLDAYDWMGKVDELAGEFKPEATLVWFGTNDRQPMRTDTGVVQLDAPEWREEYARRVGEVMDKLTAAKGAEVYWFEVPVMRDEEMNREVAVINDIVKAEAEKRDAVTYFPTSHILTRKEGQFAPYLIGPTGRPIKVREPDGVHLSRPGADLVAEAVVKELY